MNVTDTRRCTCHSIREGSGGITYSYYMLGVLCPSCESAAEEEYLAYERAQMTPEQIDAEEEALRSMHQDMFGDDEPPF